MKLTDEQKLNILKEHQQRLLDILEHEIRDLERLQWRARIPENKEKYYEKILVTREIQTIINNL